MNFSETTWSGRLLHNSLRKRESTNLLLFDVSSRYWYEEYVEVHD